MHRPYPRTLDSIRNVITLSSSLIANRDEAGFVVSAGFLPLLYIVLDYSSASLSICLPGVSVDAVQSPESRYNLPLFLSHIR